MRLFAIGPLAKVFLVVVLSIGLPHPAFGRTSTAESAIISNDESCSLDSSDLLSDKRLSHEDVEELRAELSDPHSMPGEMLENLTRRFSPMPGDLAKYIVLRQSFPPELMPLSRQHDRQVADLTGEFLDALVTVLPKKEGPALSDAVYLVTDWQSHRSKPLSHAAKTCLQQAMGGVFPRVSFDEQLRALEGRYYSLWASDALTTHLTKLYQRFGRTHSESQEAQIRVYRRKILKGLVRADPRSAREIILREVASPEPKTDIEVLGLLPDEVLPEMDRAFAEHLGEAYEDASWDELLTKLAVIERYASGRIFPEMKAFYSAHEKEWHREQRALFFSYFLRVEPSVGRDFVERGLKDKKDSDTLLTDIANIRASQELEPIAIRELTNSDGRIAGDAADVLQRIGHADVEPLLWQGLEAWHNRWAGRRSAERGFPATAYRDGVVEALLYSHAWVMTKEKLEHVHELGMPEDSAVYAVGNFPWLEDPIRVFAYKGPEELQIKIGYYGYSSVEEAEQHLRMFPGGLHFSWYQQVDPTQEDTLRPVLERLSSIIVSQGSSIQLQREN